MTPDQRKRWNSAQAEWKERSDLAEMTGLEVVLVARPVLSEREMLVLAGLRAACSNQEIADRLQVSVETVKSQVKSIHAKLGAKSRGQAVNIAQKFGICE